MPMQRRELLQWLVFSCSPAGLIVGCGRGGGNAAPETPSLAAGSTLEDPVQTAAVMCTEGDGCTPLIMRYTYASNSIVPESELELAANLYYLTMTADRFGLGGECYEFNGTNSLAVAHKISAFPLTTFAVSFWANSTVTAPMQAICIAAGSTPMATVEFNDKAAVRVFWADLDTPLIITGTPGQFADGVWHHYLVQFDGQMVQALVDGALVGSGQADLLNGAADLYVGGATGTTWNGAMDDVRLHDRNFDVASVPHLVYTWASMKPATRNDSLLAYYPFDGNAVNENGRGFDGTEVDISGAVDRWGQADRAFAFNGRTSYVELPTAFGPISTDFCIAFWMQSSTMAQMTAFSITKGATPDSMDVNFVVNAGYALTVQMDALPGLAIAYGKPGALTDGKWHFIVLQRVGTVLQLYVDAELHGTVSNDSGVMTVDSVIRFGRASGTSSVVEDYWDGSLDDIQLYNTSFGIPDLEALMQLQFRPRDGAGPLVLQDKMWLLGGWNPADAEPTNDQVWSSEDGTNWSFVGNAPWERRHAAGWLVYGGSLWVVGGDNNTGHYQNDVWSSSDGVNWIEVTDTVPWANRATQYTLVFDSKMWLMGGQQLGSQTVPGQAYNDVYSSTDGKSWTQVTPAAAWSPRGLIMGNVVFAGKMWVIGGGTYDIRTYLNDVWNSADGVNWTQVSAAAPWAGRQYHCIAVFAGKIWVLAGAVNTGSGGSTDVWYSPDGTSWTQLGDTPWLARHAASAWVFQNALWFGCGSDAVAYNDIWRLTFAS
ncbi:MAG TPA: LamG-like jellyroll fold domain-containing protein [Steroidobacteraceae bacterium]|nr:LamG-like jellyroll fold domain-containing protein [Steroidobacteraceae bacterium]